MSPRMRAFMLHAAAFGAGLVAAWIVMTMASALVMQGPEGVALPVLAGLGGVAALLGFAAYAAVLAYMLKARMGAGWWLPGAGATVGCVMLALFVVSRGWFAPMEALILLLILLFALGGAAVQRLVE